MVPVHTTKEEFENEGYTLKTHLMFSVHIMPEKLKKKPQQSPIILEVFLRKTQSGKSRDYHDVIVFGKLHFQNVFRPHENEKPAFLNCSGVKSVFIKLHCRDGILWTVGLTDRKPNRRNNYHRENKGNARIFLP